MSAYYCETRVFYVPLQDGPGLIIKLVLLLNSEQFLLEWRRKRRGRMDFFLFPVLVSIPPAQEGSSGFKLQLLLTLSNSAALDSLKV